MKRPIVAVALGVLLCGLMAGCTQAAPAPTAAKPPAAPAKAAEPTKAAPAPAAPTKAPEPTKPAAPTKAPEPAKPTAAPAAKKVDFPSGGKPITIMVPYAAGGLVDVGARLLAPGLEKELGTPVQVVNKPGAGSQVALTELFGARPDGYTLSYAVLPTVITHYMDPERKAPYTRAGFQPVALHFRQPISVAVQTDSPYKTIKDLIDAAKANPEKIKVGTSGVMATPHLTILQTEHVTGARFAAVHFEGGAPALTALLGGHIDVQYEGEATHVPQVKSGKVRALAVSDKQESKFLPGVPTFESQGYKVNVISAQGILAPAGTPKEVVDLVSGAIKKVTDAPEHKNKLLELGYTPDYRDAQQYAAFWAEFESQIAPLIQTVKK